MILVHKAPQFLPTTTPSVSHRRHPSAPPAAVVVQPTRTPGLLSLSKPSRPVTPRQDSRPRQQRSPKKTPAGQHQQRSPKPAQKSGDDEKKGEDGVQVSVQPVPPSPARKAQPQTQTPTPAPSPEKNNRGRQHGKAPKEKGSRRSTSHSTVRASARRPHQPSPPPPSDQAPSQAEVHNKPSFPNLRNRNPNVNAFETFAASSDESDTARPDSAPASPPKNKRGGPGTAIPKLTARPSGKLAKRRQQVPESPTPLPKIKASKPVPVPRSKTPSGQRERDGLAGHVSRSVPIRTSAGLAVPGKTRPGVKRSSTASASSLGVPSWDFPICDDTDDTDELTPPSTPIRGKALPAGSTWQQALALDDGPRTAPLTATSAWPFGGSPSTPTRSKVHHRTPSEGVFHLSFDEDLSLSSGASSASEVLKEMKGLIKRRSMPSRRSSQAPSIEEQDGEAPYFASSMFQNSPSPDDLPTPAFGGPF